MQEVRFQKYSTIPYRQDTVLTSHTSLSKVASRRSGALLKRNSLESSPLGCIPCRLGA